MTLREFITAFGGWEKIKSKLVIRTSDCYIICNLANYNGWDIQQLLDNQMWLPARTENDRIYVYVQD